MNGSKGDGAMTTSKQIFYPVVLTLLLSACGGGGGENVTNVGSSNNEASTSGNIGQDSSSSVTATRNLVADESFRFTLDREVSLRFSGFPSNYGKVNIYFDYEYHDSQSGTYYPDHRTLLASYVASTQWDYTVMITPEHRYLVLEWLPMDGLSNESYQIVELNNQSSYYVGF